MNLKRRLKVLALLGSVLIAGALVLPRIGVVRRLAGRLEGKKTVEDRLAQYGPAARSRLAKYFQAKGISYPPDQIVLLVLKDEKVLKLYAEDKNRRMVMVRDYPVLAASGEPGPKLREGDCQVPEGIYRVVFLNPNSLYHLSMRLDYPNEFDREMAAAEGRTNLGGDIMIHGSNVSIGCVAVGDEASEDLFVLAADTGTENAKVIIAPRDLRKKPYGSLPAKAPRWTGKLYKMIADEIGEL